MKRTELLTVAAAGVAFAAWAAWAIVLAQAWPAGAQTRISQLPTASALGGTELVPVIQSGANRVTPAAIGTYLQGALGAWPTTSGTPTAGHCAAWLSATLIGDSGTACGSGGSGTPGGSSGQIQYNNAGAFGGLAVTGSGSVVEATSPTLVTPALGTPSALVLTNATGLPNASVIGLAASATTDATNAGNIASGTLPSGRLSGAYTGITGIGTLTAGAVPASLITGLGTFATQNYASPPAIGGTTPAAGSFSSLTDTAMTGGPFCVSETSGVLSATAAACATAVSGANPTGTIGLTAVNGSATTYMRSDAAPALGTQGANTLIANVGASTATPTYASLPSCSTPNSALQYTSGAGLSCLTTIALTGANTFTGAQTVPTSDLRLVGASTGYTTLNSGLASTSNSTLTLPTEAGDTLVDLTGTQTLTNKTVNGLALTANATGFSLAGGTTSKTATFNNTLTFAGTDGQTMTFPAASTTVAGLGTTQTFTAANTFGASVVLSSSLKLGSGAPLIMSQTAPTITSGLGTSPAVTYNSGSAAFVLTAGASGTPSATVVLGMPAASHGWICNGSDLTRGYGVITSGSLSTTSVTLTVSTAPSNSDVLGLTCMGV
jgi:hypothetical protein